MAGPPAFQFYPADFVMGTLVLSNACVGAYIRLLCYQWTAGGIPNNEHKIAYIVQESRDIARALWQNLASKFELGSDGLYRNKRLETVRQKQLAFMEKQARNGRAGGLAKAKRSSGATVSPQPEASQEWPQPKPSSSIFDLRSSSSSSVQKRKNAAARRAPRSQAVDTPKISTLAALMRTELLPKVNGETDEGDIVEAAKRLAAKHKLAYTGSAIRRALASARGQLAKRGH